MINFEEELAKFKPSLDITDILQELMNEIKK